MINVKKYCLIIIPSAIAFFALLASDKSSMVTAFQIGILFGIGGHVYLSRIRRHNKLEQLLSALIGILLCYISAKQFYKIWESSINHNQLRTIVTSMFSDYNRGLLTISFFAALVALPFSVILVRIILFSIIRYIYLFDFKKFKSELLNNVSTVSVLKRTGMVVLRLSLSVVVGTVLLFCVYIIPTDRIEYNVKKSANIIKIEGVYPRLFERFTSQLDNYMDSLMMLKAANDIVNSPLIDAMNVPSGHIDGSIPNEELIAHYIDGVEYDRVTDYRRYWHGYLVILKPLLYFFDYVIIRTINGISQILLVFTVCFLLYKKELQIAIIPYLVSYGMLMPLVLVKSLQFSSCFYILTLESIGLLLLPQNKLIEKYLTIFLYGGILTAFFDLLVYPIATFGVPMCFFLLLTGTDSAESKTSKIVKGGLIWCIGYACMWASKWIIGSVITGHNIIFDAIAQMAIRTSTKSAGGEEQYSIVGCVLSNYRAFFKTPISVCVIICIIFLISYVLKNNNNSYDSVLKIIFPFLLTGLAPIVWYAFTTNHSVIHVFFTNKACITSLMAVLFGLVCIIQNCKLPVEGFAKQKQSEIETKKAVSDRIKLVRWVWTKFWTKISMHVSITRRRNTTNRREHA